MLCFGIFVSGRFRFYSFPPPSEERRRGGGVSSDLPGGRCRGEESLDHVEVFESELGDDDGRVDDAGRGERCAKGGA